MNKFWVIFGVSLFFFSTPGLAERYDLAKEVARDKGESLAPTKRIQQWSRRGKKAWQPQATRRRLASLSRTQESNRVTGSAFARPEASILASIGINTGYAQTDTNNSNRQRERDRSGFHQRASIGINPSFEIKKYVVLDIDGFFVDGPGQQATRIDNALGTVENGERRLRLYGGMSELRGRYPFWLGDVKLVPSIGGGYGLIQLSELAEGGTSTRLQVNAPYGTIGLSATFFKRLTVLGDYSLSFSASGTLDSEQNETILSSQDIDSSEFNRLRAGALYRLSQPLSLGVQYIRRQVKRQASGETTPISETTNQFLGTMVLHF